MTVNSLSSNRLPLLLIRRTPEECVSRLPLWTNKRRNVQNAPRSSFYSRLVLGVPDYIKSWIGVESLSRQPVCSNPIRPFGGRHDVYASSKDPQAVRSQLVVKKYKCLHAGEGVLPCVGFYSFLCIRGYENAASEPLLVMLFSAHPLAH